MTTKVLGYLLNFLTEFKTYDMFEVLFLVELLELSGPIVESTLEECQAKWFQVEQLEPCGVR